MNTLYWLITITDRHSTDAFLTLYEEHGITVSLRTVGAGTAVRETLSTLGAGTDRKGRALCHDHRRDLARPAKRPAP